MTTYCRNCIYHETCVWANSYKCEYFKKIKEDKEESTTVQGYFPTLETLKIPEGDLISRKAALEAIDEAQYSAKFCEDHNIDHSINLGMAHIVINNLPAMEIKKTNPMEDSEKDKIICFLDGLADAVEEYMKYHPDTVSIPAHIAPSYGNVYRALANYLREN